MSKNNMLENKFNGDVEAYKSYLKEIGSKGGQWQGKKGFAVLSKDEARKISSKGGKAKWANVKASNL